MQKQCQNSEGLIPSYLDGELSEEQAAPLRKHLMECQPCRDLAQDEQAMKRWFIAEEAPVAPPGFAARIARRAFAGDEGLLPDTALELQPHSAAARTEAPVLQFVLKLTAVAAAALFCLALAIRNHSLPESDDLGAVEDYSEVLEDLERLNEAEAGSLLQLAPEDPKRRGQDRVGSGRKLSK